MKNNEQTKYEQLSEDLTENKITFEGFVYSLIQDTKHDYNYLYVSFVDLENKKNTINRGHHPYLVLESSILENSDKIKIYIDKCINIENEELENINKKLENKKKKKIPLLPEQETKKLINTIFTPLKFDIQSEEELKLQEKRLKHFNNAVKNQRFLTQKQIDSEQTTKKWDEKEKRKKRKKEMSSKCLQLNTEDYNLEGKAYKLIQKEGRIYYKYTKIETYKDNNGENIYEEIDVTIDCLDGFLKTITYYIDDLDDTKNYYEVIYHNDVSKKDTSLTGSLKEISKELNKFADYTKSDKDLLALLSDFKRESTYNKTLEIKHFYSIEGYFIHNNEFIDNNQYLNNKYNKQYKEDYEEFKKELNDKIEHFKEYLTYLEESNNNVYFTEVAKVVLIMPYYYIFKEIEFQDPIKYILLYGKAKNGKSTNSNYILTLYQPKHKNKCRAGTKAALKNELNNYNTLPLMLEEAKDLITKSDVQEVLKDARYNIDIKGSANLDKQGSNIEYRAFHHYVFNTNDPNNIFEGLSRGILCYDFKYKPKTDSEKWNKLIKNIDFSIIGYAFSKIMEIYYNKYGSDSILEYTNQPNEFINQLLCLMEKEYNLNLSFLKFVNPYEDINDELNHNTVEDLADNLQNDYNNYELKWNKKISTSLEDFIRNNRNSSYKHFKFIEDTNKRSAYYSINQKKLNRFLIIKSNKGIVTIEDLLEFRELENNIPKINDISLLEGIDGVFLYTGNKTTTKGTNINPNTVLISEDKLRVLFNVPD